MKKYTQYSSFIILVIIAIILFLLISLLFSCRKQKSQAFVVGSAPEELAYVQDAIVTEPVVLDSASQPAKKKTRWIEEKKYSGNRGYIIHDGVYVYFGHVAIERKEIIE